MRTLIHLAQDTGFEGEQLERVDFFASLPLLMLWVAVMVFFIATLWRIFTKAGQPGWAAIIPIYNYVVLLKIVGRPVWWLLLYLIPIVNIVILVIVMIDLAKSFGKSGAFAAGLIFLGFIFLPILAFGDARYLGPAASGGAANPV